MNFPSSSQGYQILLTLCLTTLGCTDRPFPTGEILHGYWYETAWTYDFIGENHFVFTSDGHYAVELSDTGTYRIHGDTLFLEPGRSSLRKDGVVNERYLIDRAGGCIIDLYMKYDYCRDPERASRFRAVEYPQLATKDTAIVRLIDSLLLVHVAELLATEDYRQEIDSVVVAPYYHVGTNWTDSTSVAGLPLRLHRAAGDTLAWNDHYVDIREINYVPRRRLSFHLNAYPSPWRHSVLAYYTFRGGKWVRSGS